MLSARSVTMHLAPSIVQSEVLNYNDSLSAAFSASQIHDRGCKYLGTMLVLCVIAAASDLVKTGIPMSNCDISAYEKMRIPKVKV